MPEAVLMQPLHKETSKSGGRAAMRQSQMDIRLLQYPRRNSTNSRRRRAPADSASKSSDSMQEPRAPVRSHTRKSKTLLTTSRPSPAAPPPAKSTSGQGSAAFGSHIDGSERSNPQLRQ